MRGARGQEGRVWGEAGKQALDTLDLKWEPPWSATGHAGPGFLLVLKDQAPSELGGSLETTVLLLFSELGNRPRERK